MARQAYHKSKEGAETIYRRIVEIVRLAGTP